MVRQFADERLLVARQWLVDRQKRDLRFTGGEGAGFIEDDCIRVAMGGLVVFGLLLLLAIFADVISPYPYDRVFLNLRASMLPGVDPQHALGLDTSSRDYLSRLIYGARTSVTVGLLVPLIAFGIVAENAHSRAADCCGDMHRPSIYRHRCARLCERARKLRQRRLAAQIDQCGLVQQQLLPIPRVIAFALDLRLAAD